MRALLVALLAPVLASASLDYGRKGDCLAVTATKEHLGGNLRIVASNDGQCRKGVSWWTGIESSGHFRVDAGCKLTLYPIKSCASRRRPGSSFKVLDATRSSKSRTHLISNYKDLGIDNWVRASKCECTGAAMMRRREEDGDGALSLDRAANRSVLVEEEEEDDEELEEDEEDGDADLSLDRAANRSVLVEESEEEEEDEEALDEDEEDEDEEEEEEEASLAQVRAEASFPQFNQWSNRRFEGDNDHRRRRHFNWGGSASCAWVWYAKKNAAKHHRSWVRFAGRNQCVNARANGKGLEVVANKQSSAYALTDPRCRVIFYASKNCGGDREKFNPRDKAFEDSGSARILGDLGKIGLDNDIESMKCFCRGR